ncbi:hypothetical protein L7F22_039859 [Adiantum nelumboides]|nr:hypothetical protein [Adiantum nelumboides]
MNYSEDPKLPIFALKVLSRFMGHTSLQGNANKILMLERAAALRIFGCATGFNASRASYFLCYSSYTAAAQVSNVDLLGGYKRRKFLRDPRADEEAAIAKEITMVKKERELLLLQERVASRERVLEQHELHVKDIEAFVSRERERVEAFETKLRTKEAALLQQQRDLIDLQRSIEQQKGEVEAKCAEYEILLAELERKLQEAEAREDAL